MATEELLQVTRVEIQALGGPPEDKQND